MVGWDHVLWVIRWLGVIFPGSFFVGVKDLGGNPCDNGVHVFEALFDWRFPWLPWAGLAYFSAVHMATASLAELPEEHLYCQTAAVLAHAIDELQLEPWHDMDEGTMTHPDQARRSSSFRFPHVGVAE